jgi:hypothetical protein
MASLGAVKDGVIGEQASISLGVTAGAGRVSPADHVEDFDPLGWRQDHAVLPGGRSQAPIRSWISAGKMLLGMTACTALAGMELYADPVWLAYWVTRKLTAMLASA